MTNDYNLTQLMNFLIDVGYEVDTEWNPFADIQERLFPNNICSILWQGQGNGDKLVFGVFLNNGHFAYIEIDEETEEGLVIPDTDRQSLDEFMPEHLKRYFKKDSRPSGDEPEESNFDLADEI
jgi:hypothetical protein